MDEKRPVGRPRSPDPRTRQVIVALTESEGATLDRLRGEQSAASYLYRVVSRALKRLAK